MKNGKKHITLKIMLQIVVIYRHLIAGPIELIRDTVHHTVFMDAIGKQVTDITGRIDKNIERINLVVQSIQDEISIKRKKNLKQNIEDLVQDSKLRNLRFQAFRTAPMRIVTVKM
ncbi:hypothetical protein WA026_013861 [Henosepilachna vigintioctopunctata]|uniref:Uncharacterized protein n=1 Tax=Henosepilachna vigintioctopunctata TaxID=420089 RepID=A0AAW1US66_9CUCU